MSSILEAFIRERIQSHGPMPFPTFMELALYHPEHGYYSSGRATIGRGGDFFTSVSVGPIFGRLLARQFAEIWERLASPDEFTIVEQGAHGGDFARDVLEALRIQSPECFRRIKYQIIEPAPSLRERQAIALQNFDKQACWAATLNDVPPWTGVHFSNELIDAFPVHRVRWTGNEWQELYVGLDENGFIWYEGPITDSPSLRAKIHRLPSTFPPGYEIELNVAAESWLSEVAAKLNRGWLLAIDYGYPRDEFFRLDRKGGTLAGYCQHRRVENPILSPGDIDLTAHVEFTSIAEQAEQYGLTLAGFTDQHHFMVGLSRLHFSDAIGTLSPEQERDLRGFKTLMHPGLMGMSFKAIALGKGVDHSPPLAGFAFARNPEQELGLHK